MGTSEDQRKAFKRRCFVWGTCLLFTTWTVLIIAAQNANGFGPFYVDSSVPHEGRYVFAGLMQLLGLLWCCSIAFGILNRAGLCPLDILLTASTTHRPWSDDDQRHLFRRVGYLAAALSNMFLIDTGMFLYTGIYVIAGTNEKAVHTVAVAPVVIQFITWALVILPLVLPYPMPVWFARKGILQDLVTCFGAALGVPLFTMGVNFNHVLLTDILTSATLMLWDLCYSICHFAHSDWSDTHVTGSDGMTSPDPCGSDSVFMSNLKTAVYCLPFWMRLIQCLALLRETRQRRHLVNAGKYTSAMMVIFASSAMGWVSAANFDTARGFWIASLVIKTIYCSLWDVKMDWGLGDTQSAYYLLRERIFFRPWLYYVALVANMLGRVSWGIALSPTYCKEACTLSLGVVEIFRRAQWIVYRMELAALELQMGEARQLTTPHARRVSQVSFMTPSRSMSRGSIQSDRRLSVASVNSSSVDSDAQGEGGWGACEADEKPNEDTPWRRSRGTIEEEDS